MYKLYLCAYQLRSLRPAKGVVNVHIVTDDPEKFSEADCRRTLSPWSDWVRFGVYRADPDPAILQHAGVSRNDVLMTLCENFAPLHSAAKPLGIHCLAPVWPKANSLDHDFAREVSFHDHELGGVDEWNDAPTTYSRESLWLLSSAHCRRFYPSWATKLLPADLPRPLNTLDIGCGPVSRLRYGAVTGELSITGLDPLVDMYALILARHGHHALPKIRCDREVLGFAEDMDTLLEGERFDFIYTTNAIDHTQRPDRVVQHIANMLTPQGIALISVATREGTRRNWDQLHKTDIYFENDTVWFKRQNSRPQPLLTHGLTLRHIHTNTDAWLVFAVAKDASASPSIATTLRTRIAQRFRRLSA